jgi:hypothetical protein
MSKKLYVVADCIPWKDCVSNLGIPFGGDGTSYGYMPVYEDEEKAREKYPDAEIWIISMKEREAEDE